MGRAPSLHQKQELSCWQALADWEGSQSRALIISGFENGVFPAPCFWETGFLRPLQPMSAKEDATSGCGRHTELQTRTHLIPDLRTIESIPPLDDRVRQKGQYRDWVSLPKNRMAPGFSLGAFLKRNWLIHLTFYTSSFTCNRYKKD